MIESKKEGLQKYIYKYFFYKGLEMLSQNIGISKIL